MSLKKLNNGQYQVRFRDATKRQRAKSFARKSDALDFEAKIRRELKNGIWIDPVISQTLLEEVWLDFMHLKKGKKPKTQTDYEDLWRVHLAPKWAKYPVSQINQIEFDKWVIGRAVSPRRIDKIHLLMSMLLDHAVSINSLYKNPLKLFNGRRNRTNLPTPSTEVATHFLTLEELFNVAENAGYYRDLILFLGLCAPRWGEVVGLQVKHLNILNGTVVIRRTLVEVNGTLIEGSTKNHRARIIELPAELRDVCHRWVFGKNPEDPLFHTERGALLRNTNFARRVLQPALKASGVGHIRIHDLRHTAATISVSIGGSSIKGVQDLLGHSSPSLTMGVYAHVMPNDRKIAMDRLNAAIASLDRSHGNVHQLCIESSNGVPAEVPQVQETGADQHLLWWGGSGSNRRRPDYESGALTN